MKGPLIEETQEKAKINVTPIIDVALVLVIILLITAPMIAVSDMPIELPQAKTRSVNSDARINITLGVDGSVAVDETTVSRSALGQIVAERVAEEDDLMIVMRADSGVEYDAVEDLMKMMRSAGAKRLAIATRQHGPGEK